MTATTFLAGVLLGLLLGILATTIVFFAVVIAIARRDANHQDLTHVIYEEHG